MKPTPVDFDVVTENIPHVYYVEPGGAHDFKACKSGLYMFSKLIFK